MNACNLFGRPWQYNVNAWHGGQENIYRFVKDGINFTLIPLKRNSQPKAQKAGGKALKQMSDNAVEVTGVVKSLLQEFQEVIPDKLRVIFTPYWLDTRG